MPRRPSNPSLYQVSTLSRGDLGRRLGWTRNDTTKRLARNAHHPWLVPDHRGRYDARSLDLLRALYGQHHDNPDWLANYLSERHL